MNSFRLRAVAALGLGFGLLPIPRHLFQLVIPPAYADAPAPQTPCTWSRSPVIRLPLQIDERTRATLSEIRLHVKPPGSDWALASSGPSTQINFDYRAAGEGLYSFMFVTVDKAGRSFPASLDSRPAHQLIVIDTTPPELSVVPMPVANRDIFLQVRMDDANPNLASVKLEYAFGDNDWRAMELVQANTLGIFRIPHASVLEGKVRATGKDKAGNVAQRIVDLGDPTQSFVSSKTKNTETTSQEPIKTEPMLADPVSPTPATPERISAKLADSADLRITEPLDTRITENAPKGPVSVYNPNRPDVPPPADPVLIPEPPAIVDPKSADDRNLLPPNDVREATPAKRDPYFPSLEAPPAPASQDQSNKQQPPAPYKDEPPGYRDQERYNAPAQQGAVKNEPAPLKIEPAVVDVRPASPVKGSIEIIGTPRCLLDYAVEDVVLGAAAKIEFWATRDNGRTWQRVQDEAGGRAPARLLLPGDGVFGIRVKANGNGQSPGAGEAPDAWVEVDTTRPTVRLMPPVIGTGADAGTLTIQWMVQDKNLISDSINIYHAARPDGPWLPIARGLRNEGSFRWLMPVGIGADIYLRVDATDRAGNIGQSELRDPVNLPQPKVRILGIGPAR